MIDLKDEKQKYYYLNKCISRKPIDFYGLKIYPPILDDIFDMGEDNYKELLLPFILSRDLCSNKSSDMRIFEILMNDKQTIISLILSLSYFMKIDIVENVENDEGVIEKKENIKIFSVEDKNIGRNRNKIIIKDKLIIDDDKFDELKSLILLMCNVKEITRADLDNANEDKPISESKKKLLKGRKQSGTNNIEEKRVKLVNVYDYIVHKPSMPDYDRYLHWSIYQVYNTYSNMIQKENVQFTYDVITNGMGTKDMKLESLADKIIK